MACHTIPAFIPTSHMQVLEWLSFGHTSIRSKLVQQSRIMAFYYLASYSILRANKPRFLHVHAPAAGSASTSPSHKPSTSGAALPGLPQPLGMKPLQPAAATITATTTPATIPAAAAVGSGAAAAAVAAATGAEAPKVDEAGAQ